MLKRHENIRIEQRTGNVDVRTESYFDNVGMEVLNDSEVLQVGTRF